jgi:signal transduction histidine kinase
MDPLRLPLHKRLRPGHWVAIDYAITVLMALAYVVLGRDLARLDGPRWAAATVVAVSVLPAAARRPWPRAVLALVVVGQAVATALGANPQPALAVAFVMYLIPLRFPRREALWWLAASLLTMAAGLLALRGRTHISPPVRNAAGVLLISALLITVAWMIGYSVRQQRAYTAAQQLHAQRQARAEIAEARRAISEQRLQIARELHDVVAHTMSVIAVQAGVANYVINEDPQEAARALSSIEKTSRGALSEMRALLGMLRTDDGPGTGPAGPDRELVPTPGLADLDALVEKAANAGLVVDLDIHGERPQLPAGLDLAAYRVVQEATTNVIKHAATDRCSVTVAYQPEALTLQVTDRGRRTPGSLAVGHGIIGMRERVAMYGGQLRAAPMPGHGFQVTARFPLPAGRP